MNDSGKISYYDLRLESRARRLPQAVGFGQLKQRLNRTLMKKIGNNCLVTGPSGSGKTAFILGWAQDHAQANPTDKRQIVAFDPESFFGLNSPTAGNLLARFNEALSTLPECVVVIDDFGSLVYNKPLLFQNIVRLFKPLLENKDTALILSLKPHEYEWIAQQEPTWLNSFENFKLTSQGNTELLEILKLSLNKFNKAATAAPERVLNLIISYCQKFSLLGQLPGSAVKLLDEALAEAQSFPNQELSELTIHQIVSDKTNIPLTQLTANEYDILKNLQEEFGKKIVGQGYAVGQIVTAVQRAKLGLKNPGRPLASFLMLGPSGVGKTEAAKVLSAAIFGKKESFIRIDMSEFAQEHTTARLLGAPAGYVGYQEGGQLTQAVKQQPYSLILLDEIEKAHNKIFDVFLQILDDGRLTSGRGETSDFTQTIIMATSNLAAGEITQGWQSGEDIHSEDFFRKKLLPVLTSSFRPEFLNRFDAVLIFKPLGISDLVDIAELEIKHIEQRVKQHNIKFTVEREILEKKIKELADPRFGARPVKRFVEEMCEGLIVKTLLK